MVTKTGQTWLYGVGLQRNKAAFEWRFCHKTGQLNVATLVLRIHEVYFPKTTLG